MLFVGAENIASMNYWSPDSSYLVLPRGCLDDSKNPFVRERRLTATLHQQKCPVFHLGSNGTYKTNSQIRPHL